MRGTGQGNGPFPSSVPLPCSRRCSSTLPPVPFPQCHSSCRVLYVPTTTGVSVTVPYSIATAPVRTGVERAVLVRRTYGLVFVGIIVTMLGVAFTLSQQALLEQS